MQPPAKRLGRGLSSLISVGEQAPTTAEAALPPSKAPSESGNRTIKTDQLRPNPFQPRKDIPPDQLQALAESIRKTGVIQPIVARPAQAGTFEIIAGERRWRAAQLAGLSEVPALIREADDQAALEIALVENIFREDLNAIDRAQAYRRYCDEFHLSADEVAQRLGEDRSTVTNYLRLLDLPGEVKNWVAEGKLSMGHARALLGLRTAADQVKLARQAIDAGLSVRKVEELVRLRLQVRMTATQPREDNEAKRPQIRTLEQAFVQALGTKVEINETRRKGRGKIVIHYFSLDDFDRILERLGLEDRG
ncbi:MAG: chromosome partitioning protein ParB [Phycisphaerae bacterium]